MDSANYVEPQRDKDEVEQDEDLLHKVFVLWLGSNDILPTQAMDQNIIAIISTAIVGRIEKFIDSI